MTTKKKSTRQAKKSQVKRATPSKNSRTKANTLTRAIAAVKKPRAPAKKSGATTALDTKILNIRKATGLLGIPSTRKALQKIPKAKKKKLISAFDAIKNDVHFVTVPKKTITKAKKHKARDIIPVGGNVVMVQNKSTWSNAKVKAGEPFKGEVIHTKPIGDGEMQMIVFPDSIKSITQFDKQARKNQSFQNKKAPQEKFTYAFPSRAEPGKLNFVQIEFTSAASMAKHMLQYLPDDDDEDFDEENERLWDNITVFRILGKNEMREERLVEQAAAIKQRERERLKNKGRKTNKTGRSV